MADICKIRLAGNCFIAQLPRFATTGGQDYASVGLRRPSIKMEERSYSKFYACVAHGQVVAVCTGSTPYKLRFWEKLNLVGVVANKIKH